MIDYLTYKGKLNTYDRTSDKSTIVYMGELPFHGSQSIADALGKATGHDIEAFINCGRTQFRIWKKKKKKKK